MLTRYMLKWATCPEACHSAELGHLVYTASRPHTRPRDAQYWFTPVVGPNTGQTTLATLLISPSCL